MADEASAFVTLARIAKVQGRVGEVAADLFTDFPERFEDRRRLYGWREGQERRELKLQEFWPHKGRIVLKFEGVDSIEEAEKLLGMEVQIPREERAKLEEGAVYVSDLVGCTLFDFVAGELGKIAEVDFGAGAAPLLLVKNANGKEFMIPFVEGFTKSMDFEAKRIEMELPEGLLDLDAPLSAEEKDQQHKGQ